MYLVDINILLHATIASAQWHPEARSWLDRKLNGRMSSVGLPWHSLLGFVRIASGPRFVDPPISVGNAWQQVERWLDAPAAWIPVPGRGHRHIIGQLIDGTKPTSKMIADFHLAALAVENGLTVASTDTDFGRLPGVRWVNPVRAV
ncbi:MAG TPA: TA system VapC family ribonuclease toxin [Pseudonocardiaceae bacterium]|jgi:hypothetical protein